MGRVSTVLEYTELIGTIILMVANCVSEKGIAGTCPYDTVCTRIVEKNAMYEYQDGYMPPSSEDLLSLEELSYAIRVEATTIRRNWIETGKLQPDAVQLKKSRTLYFFYRHRIETIREEFDLPPMPQTGLEWIKQLVEFMESRNLTRSYKPVLLKAMLRLADSKGEVAMDTLVASFRAFYVQRKRHGLVTEMGVSALLEPEQSDADTIEQLIIKHPLERFVLNGFLHYDAGGRIVRFNPMLWDAIRQDDLARLATLSDAQLDAYYSRRAGQA